MSPTKYDLTVYFAPHFDDYLAPLQTEDFLTNFKRCNLFILELAEPWIKDEPDKETLYNQLSEGKVNSVPSKRGPLSPFIKELQMRLRGSGKRVALERSTAPQVQLSLPSDLVNSLEVRGLDGTLVLYKKEIQDLANSMVERDRSIIRDVLQRELKDEIKGFMFRGSAHFRHLSALLQTQFPMSKLIAYPGPPSLTDRILGSLTVGEPVQDLDFLRSLDSELSKQGADYESCIKAESEAELLTVKVLRAKYSTPICR